MVAQPRFKFHPVRLREFPVVNSLPGLRFSVCALRSIRRHLPKPFDKLHRRCSMSSGCGSQAAIFALSRQENPTFEVPCCPTLIMNGCLSYSEDNGALENRHYNEVCACVRSRIAWTWRCTGNSQFGDTMSPAWNDFWTHVALRRHKAKRASSRKPLCLLALTDVLLVGRV